MFKKSGFYCYCFVLGGALMLLGFSSAWAASQNLTPVVITKVFTQQIVPQAVSAYGTVMAPKSVAVKAKISGTVKQIDFNPGQKIQKGQLLFTLQSADVSNQLSSLKSQVDNAKSHYDRGVADNSKGLGRIISLDNLAFDKSSYEQKKAAYLALKSETQVTAPVSGIVSDTTLSAGDSIQGGDLLVTIINKQSLQVEYALSNNDAQKAQLGQKVLFMPNGSTNQYQAKVSYVAPQLDATSGMVTVHATFLNASSLQSNMFGQVVQVLNSNHKILAVPQSLVRTDEQGFYVYVVELAKVAKQYVQVGSVNQQGYIEITQGLKLGMPIIISSADNLSVGQSVKVKAQ